jgi:hypothetical protein
VSPPFTDHAVLLLLLLLLLFKSNMQRASFNTTGESLSTHCLEFNCTSKILQLRHTPAVLQLLHDSQQGLLGKRATRAGSYGHFNCCYKHLQDVFRCVTTASALTLICYVMRRYRSSWTSENEYAAPTLRGKAAVEVTFLLE